MYLTVLLREFLLKLGNGAWALKINIVGLPGDKEVLW